MDEKTIQQGASNSFEKRFFTIDEISTLFGIKKNTLYQLTAAKKIKHYKPGRNLRFTIDDVNEYILSTQR